MPNLTHIAAGDLNRKITIQSSSDVSDGAGGVMRGWKDTFYVWAQILPSSGSRPYFAEQIYPKAEYAITIRFRRGVTEGQRVLYGTRLFLIKSVKDPYEEHVSLVMQCEELQAKGSIK